MRALNDHTWSPGHTARILERCAGALRTAANHFPTALVVRPGDRVLIALRHMHLELSEAEGMRDELLERFPGVEFSVIGGVEQVVVQRDDTEHPDHERVASVDPVSPPLGG